MDSSGKAVDLTATLHVKGMSCPLCANNIDKQLLRVPGVTGVTVDLGTGQVRARLVPDNPPGRQALARAIEQSGFTLERIEMPPGLEDRP
jgi:Cu+-exporting ATPase